MEKVREKNTAWLETIRNFFKEDCKDVENENDSGYQEWKRENADIIDETRIKNLEKMMEHKDRRKRKAKDSSIKENINGEISGETNLKVKSKIKDDRKDEREIGE